MPHPARRLVAVAAAALAPLALTPAVSSAQSVLASSSFGAGAEGWAVGDFFNTGTVLTAPTFSATGGNPGGHIRTGDVSDWVAFVAPAAFLGDQSAAFGGTLAFDLNTLLGTNYNNSGLVHLSGSGLELYYNTGSVMPTAAWTPFTVGMSASPFWRVGSIGGATATAAQIQTALANVTGLRIQADIISGSDNSGLDNVVLTSASTSVPEPATVVLLGSGLAVLGGIAARRRNRV